MEYVQIKNIKIGEGRPKICVSLMVKNDNELDEKLGAIIEAAAESEIDVIEFRADFYDNLGDKESLAAILKKINEKVGEKILLFTIRSEAEGGEKLASKDIIVNDINQYVIENALADMVDLELFSGESRVRELTELAHSHNVKIIMSSHDFKTTPPVDELVARLKKMQEIGADIAKIAVMPQNKLQLLDLLKATTIMHEEHADTPIVTMSMGSFGAISRVAGEIFGSAMTFASVGHASAPGQIPANELNTLLDLVTRYLV